MTRNALTLFISKFIQQSKSEVEDPTCMRICSEQIKLLLGLPMVKKQRDRAETRLSIDFGTSAHGSQIHIFLFPYPCNLVTQTSTSHSVPLCLSLPYPETPVHSALLFDVTSCHFLSIFLPYLYFFLICYHAIVCVVFLFVLNFYEIS